MSDTEEFCDNCGTPINTNGTLCPVCQAPIGYPNVRTAKKEKKALDIRLQSEMGSIKVRNIEDIASKFKEAVNDANVVIARSMIALIPIVQNPNALIATFHNQVAGNARLAENNEYDSKRESIESMLHPFYYKDVHFAALSLNSVGVKYYGDSHIQLRKELIQHRTTFFEENPFNFVKKHQLIAGENVPEGFRATWGDKGILALCKCHANLQEGEETLEDFQKVLVVEYDENPDFIEAHLFGTIHVSCIEKVTIFFSDADITPKLLFNANKKKFEELNIQTEVRGL